MFLVLSKYYLDDYTVIFIVVPDKNTSSFVLDEGSL